MSTDPLAHLNRIVRLKEMSAQLQLVQQAVAAVQARARALEADLGQDDGATAAFEDECFRQLAASQHALAWMRGMGYGTATLARFLPAPPRVAVDVGGNVGEYTAALLARWPGLAVHVFEPSPTNVPRLNERFGAETQVRVNPWALSDFDGDATLFADVPGSGMGSLSRRDLRERALAFDHADAVRVARFDRYWTEVLGRGRIDLLKLDIEGHELAALRGFGDALAQVRVMQFEFGGCNVDTHTYWRDFHRLLGEAGFALYRITPLGPEALPRYDERDEYFSTTNLVAVNRRDG